jgi:hypothetical protein
VIDIRCMTADDFESVARFAERGLQPERYPVIYSRPKLRGVIEHFMNSPTDYHRIAVDGGEVVGVIAAAMAEMAYFQRCEAHIFALYATRYGVGRQLLAGLLGWMDDHFMVQRVSWVHNPGMRPSVQRLARICGRGRVTEQLQMTVFYKE